jgi:hypothetical protein
LASTGASQGAADPTSHRHFAQERGSKTPKKTKIGSEGRLKLKTQQQGRNMKNDDEHHLFNRMKLNDETKAHLQWAISRPRNIQELLGELIIFRQYDEGNSIHIDSECKNGIRYTIDEIRALIAMTPARNDEDLAAKCLALTDPTPVVLAHGLLPIIARASVRADVFRLKPKRPLPDWLSKWIISA